MNTHKCSIPIPNCIIAFLTLALSTISIGNLHSATLPGWIISKIDGAFTGAVFDSVGGYFTREGKTVAQVDQVLLDRANSVYVQWYENKLGPYGATEQTSYNSGQQTYGIGSEIKSRKFSYHDWLYFDQYDQYAKTSPTKRISGKGYYVPPTDDSDFIQFGTLQGWTALFIVTSTYSNPTGDQGLRRPPGDYIAEVEYRLSDLDYHHETGITSVSRNMPSKKIVSLDKIATSQAQVDLLENNTELNGRANAYGACTRTWRLKTPDWNLWDVLQSDQIVAQFLDQCEWVVNEVISH